MVCSIVFWIYEEKYIKKMDILHRDIISFFDISSKIQASQQFEKIICFPGANSFHDRIAVSSFE
jgi:hypothetical protein